jgi:hypothetical protein
LEQEEEREALRALELLVVAEVEAEAVGVMAPPSDWLE